MPTAHLGLRRLVAIVCAAGLTAAVPGCGAGGGDGDSLTSVLERAAAADSGFGVRYSFRSRFTDGDGTQRLRGYGQAEADQRRARVVVVDAEVPLRGETIVDGDDEYSGGGFAARTLLATPSRDVRWTKLDLSRFRDAGFIDRLCGAELPPKVAKLLAASDPAIVKRGGARTRGVRTQRYRVTTTYGRVLDVLAGDDDASQCDPRDRAARFTAELWIDRDDLIRRVVLRHRDTNGSTVETRDITSYDRTVRVSLPDGPAVGDVTDRLLELTRSVCQTTDDC